MTSSWFSTVMTIELIEIFGHLNGISYFYPPNHGNGNDNLKNTYFGRLRTKCSNILRTLVYRQNTSTRQMSKHSL